jgi:PIN domain nuclease of toxin-antitoxin system
MKLLIDTHLLLWLAVEPAKLPKKGRLLLEDPLNEPLFSAASIWEVAIKYSLGREDFSVSPQLLRRGLLDNGYREVPITSEHGLAAASLPKLHKDPFDRMLVAQATVEGILLLTSDANVARYSGPIRKV